MADSIMQAAIDRLRQVLIRMKSGDYVTDVEPTNDEQAAVLNRFQPVLSQANLDWLTETDFRTFLMFRHNRHWTGAPRVTHLPGHARFLDYAAERIFLRKVGGGYIFVHRLLLDYFADMYEGKLERTK